MTEASEEIVGERGKQEYLPHLKGAGPAYGDTGTPVARS